MQCRRKFFGYADFSEEGVGHSVRASRVCTRGCARAIVRAPGGRGRTARRVILGGFQGGDRPCPPRLSPRVGSNTPASAGLPALSGRWSGRRVWEWPRLGSPRHALGGVEGCRCLPPEDPPSQRASQTPSRPHRGAHLPRSHDTPRRTRAGGRLADL